MKIISENSNKEETLFTDLDSGDVFRRPSEEETYLKLADGSYVDLCTGYRYFISVDFSVDKLDARLVIKGVK